MKARTVLSLLLGCAAFFSMSVSAIGQMPGNMATAKFRLAPRMSMPSYLEERIDPTFQTTFVRVTEPGRRLLPNARCDQRYCKHRYSSTQAWNADQSLVVVAKGCSGFCFLGGQDFKPRFWRRIPRGHDCKWHPMDAVTMICVYRKGVYLWQPQANTKSIAYAPQNYKDLTFGPWKGNPSDDGSMIGIRATNDRDEPVAFAMNIVTSEKHPDIALSDLRGSNKLVAMSPSGRYLFISQRTSTGKEPAYVFTVGGKMIQYWPEHHRPGHGDMTIDADGSDVYVGISKAKPDKYNVIKRRLRDGHVTVLAPYGDARHVSTRNVQLAGWAFVSYQGSPQNVLSKNYPAPFYMEIVALKIDGSGKMLRVAQTRGADHDYYSETHASPSPDGTRIIWSSNWGIVGGPISDYVTRIEPPDLSASGN